MRCSPLTGRTLPLVWLLAFLAFCPLTTLATEAFVPLTFGDYFSCQVPADWTREEYLAGTSPEGAKTYGLILTRPGTQPLPVRMAVFYYGKGNPSYPSQESFITRHSRPQLVLAEGDHYGEVTDTRVGGKNARLFERQRSEFVAPEPLLAPPATEEGRVFERPEKMARQVRVRERFLVVAADVGFYALRFTAPASCYEKFLGTFERLTDSFRALGARTVEQP